MIPPMAEDGKPLDGEEELLNGNELADGHEFFSLGTFRTSPDQRWLAYSTDFAGNERFTLRIKDLATGAALPDEIPDTYAGCAWSLDGFHRVLHDRGRRLAAVPGLAAPDRHSRHRGHHGLRGAGRALPRLGEPDPQRELRPDQERERPDQRGLAARRRGSFG